MDVPELMLEYGTLIEKLVKKHVDGFDLTEPLEIKAYLDTFMGNAIKEVGVVTAEVLKTALENDLDPEPFTEESANMLVRTIRYVVLGVFDKLYPVWGEGDRI
jgi:hypothetical protein